jgi:hypothetical protein
MIAGPGVKCAKIEPYPVENRFEKLKRFVPAWGMQKQQETRIGS